MGQLLQGIIPVEFDEDGFVVDPKRWDDGIARAIARVDGLPALTNAHMDVVHYLRAHYLRNGTLPPESLVCHDIHFEEHCVRSLFHSLREAWRVAGLPNPGEEAKAYM